MNDSAHFKAVLDGTLEEQIYQAYRQGFEDGYLERKTNYDGDIRNHDVGSGNWVINIAYSAMNRKRSS